METYTTDSALAAMGFGKFQALVLVYAGMGWVAESMEIMLLSFVGPLVREEWKISAQDESLLSSVVFFGMLIGACGWGFVSDKYGRRTGLLFSTLFTTGMGFMSALSPNYLCLMVLRFLVGIGVGGSHVFSSWFLEFVPAQNRGTWMIILSLFWTLGTVLEASLAWVVMSALSWRWLLAFTAIPCFLLLPFFGITPESPRYLCAQNRMSDATLVLERIALTNQAALPPGILTYNREIEVDRSTLTCEIDHLLLVREKECTDDNVMSSKSGSVAALRSLLSRNLRRSTLLLCRTPTAYTNYGGGHCFWRHTIVGGKSSKVQLAHPGTTQCGCNANGEGYDKCTVAPFYRCLRLSIWWHIGCSSGRSFFRQASGILWLLGAAIC